MMEELRQRYRSTFSSKADNLRMLVAGLPDSSADLRRVGHKIKGSAGAYGFPELSTLGDSLEAASEPKLVSAAHELIRALEDA